MSNSNGDDPISADTLKGLPPVTPPSGKFIAQLFVVPGIIVAVAVGCIWFVSWLVGGYLTPEQFLKDLRSTNAEVRWRRASDLAQVLKRDETLAANAKFSLDLADLLRQALRDSDESERRQIDRLRRKQTDESAETPKELQDERAFIEFLIASMGNFSLPTGVPLLNEIALKEDGADRATIALRRQLAVWALANVAENLKRYDRLPAERKTLVLSELDAETADRSADRSRSARQALDYLQARCSGTLQAMDVDQTLARCATDDDPTLRKFVALALTFWQGSQTENERMDQTLLTLSRDDGHGVDQVALSKESAKSIPIDGALRGREIRYQAVQALARRGSPHAADRLGVLGEMLDEDYQAKAFHMKLKDGRDVPDGATIGTILSGALRSVADLHHKQPSLELSTLRPAIDKLAHSDNAALRQEGERTLAALDSK
jgi:hypothetical protein